MPGLLDALGLNVGPIATAMGVLNNPQLQTALYAATGNQGLAAQLEKQRAEQQQLQQIQQADLNAARTMFPGAFGAPAAPAAPAGGVAPAAMPPMGAAPAAAGPYLPALATMETGTSMGNPNAVGPPVRYRDGTVDRAYGWSQIMGRNIGPWTREVLGREMTPQEFLADPNAQTVVTNAKFGQYVQQFGPEGAARAWFAGPGGMNNPNLRATDPSGRPFGPTVAQYGQRFAQMIPAGGPTPAAPPAAPGQLQPVPSYPSDPAVEQRLQQLRAYMTARGATMSPGLKSSLESQIKQLEEQSKPSPDISNYQLYVTQQRAAGRQPMSFDDWRQQPEREKQQFETQRAVLGTATKRIEAGMESATAASEAITAGNDLRAQLDAKGGIFSGQWAGNQLALAKIGQFLGLNPNDPRIANTETFKSTVGQQVAALVKNFGAGTSITNQDREYAEKMAAGDINLDEKSMRRVFDILEKVNRGRIDKHNKFVESVSKQAPPGAELLRTFKVETPSQYFREGQTATNPQTGAKMIFRNGAWGPL